MSIENDKASTGENMISDLKMDTLVTAELKNSPDSEQRIKKIITTAKQEAGMRALLTHLLIQIWVPILSLGSIFFVMFNRNRKTKK